MNTDMQFFSRNIVTVAVLLTLCSSMIVAGEGRHTRCVTTSTLCIMQLDSTVFILAKREMAVSVTITNMIGVPVVEFRRLHLSTGANRIDLDRFALQTGVYFLVLNGNNVHLVYRLVVRS